MKLVALYRPDSEFSRNVEDFLRELRKAHEIGDEQLRIIDYDSREGTDMAMTYGITNQPAMIIIDDNGGYIKHWEGNELPLQDEVTSYVYGEFET
ncbi:MAG TPA: hypothetical protein VMB52_00845 [Verrucomicrobiae bacterium]|nr:hypothetical protein [Verrucomicrobiae bacterium]